MTKNNCLVINQLQVKIHSQNGIIIPVWNISFQVKKGEIFALVGESGSGKTMTALSINRLLPENAAIAKGSQIFLQDKPIHHYSEVQMRQVRAKKIGMIFQDPHAALNPVMTIEDQLFEAIQLGNGKEKHTHKMIRQEALKLLEAVRIPHPLACLSLYPHQLSGGMKQRVVIALALSKQPELLIADEPTTALDVTTQAQVLNLIKEINTQFQMSILLITHDFGIVSEIADQVAVMKEGKIVEQASTTIFFSNPQDVYSKKLLSATHLMRDKNESVFTMNDVPVLKIENLKVYFPIQRGIFKRTVGYLKAVDDISLKLYEGQTLALVGESGSGKTTVGKAILRLVKATGGNILFKNQPILKFSERKLRQIRSDFQMVFQDPFSSMDPRMRIEDILEEGMIALKIGTDPNERKERIEILLEQVGLIPSLKERYAHELSGGQKQRVAIARALSVGAELIICDEPTSALDVSVQAQILKLLKSLQQELHICYLFITHNIGVVNYIADEVAVMYQGKIVEYGPIEKILKSPEHPYTKKLLDSVPYIKKYQGQPQGGQGSSS